MKTFVVALLGLLGVVAAVSDANAAVVCGRGYYWHRGGCVIVGPGPVVVPPVVVAPPVVGGPVVVGPGPRCYWRYGRRFCRW
jgi:hypothetical protein